MKYFMNKNNLSPLNRKFFKYFKTKKEKRKKKSHLKSINKDFKLDEKILNKLNVSDNEKNMIKKLFDDYVKDNIDIKI